MISYKKPVTVDSDLSLTLFRMWGGGRGKKTLPTSFSPATSTNVGIGP